MQRGGVQSYKPPNSHSGPLELLRRGVKDVVAALVSQEATVERFADKNIQAMKDKESDPDQVVVRRRGNFSPGGGEKVIYRPEPGPMAPRRGLQTPLLIKSYNLSSYSHRE